MTVQDLINVLDKYPYKSDILLTLDRDIPLNEIEKHPTHMKTVQVLITPLDNDKAAIQNKLPVNNFALIIFST